jgi:PilZ domain
MAMRTGRVEKRIPLQMPVQISGAQILGPPEPIEKATTENVSTHGVRVLTKHPLPLHERLLVTSLIGSEEPKPALVVYCQPLTGDLFGVGLQFQKETTAA